MTTNQPQTATDDGIEQITNMVESKEKISVEQFGSSCVEVTVAEGGDMDIIGELVQTAIENDLSNSPPEADENGGVTYQFGSKPYSMRETDEDEDGPSRETPRTEGGMDGRKERDLTTRGPGY